MSEVFYWFKMVESKMAEFKMNSGTSSRMNEFESDWISLSQSQSGVRVFSLVNLREDYNMSESKMAVAESNMAEFKMAATIKLSQNEWVKFFWAKWLNPRWRIQDGCHHQVELRMNDESVSESNMAEFSVFVQNGWIQDGWIEWVNFKMAAIIKLKSDE